MSGDRNDSARRGTLGALALLAALLLAELVVLYPAVFTHGDVISSSALAYGMAPWKGHTPRIERPLRANPALSDDLVLFTPWDAFIRATVHSGRLPFWCPDSGCGMPLIANNQSAVFAPTHLLRWVWNSPRARTVGLLVKVLLAGTGMLVLLRLLGATPAGALLGGMAWANSAAMTVWLLYPLSEVLAWFSWLLAGLVLVLRGSRAGPPLLALALAGTLLAGHLPTVVPVLAAAAAAVAVWALRPGAERRRLLHLALPIGAGLLLSLPQLVPTLVYAVSSGGLVGRSGYARTHLPPGVAWSWLVPRGFGSPEIAGYSGLVDFPEATASVGLAVLLLAFVGLRRDIVRVGLIVGVALSAAIAYGLPPLAPLLAHLPVLGATSAGRAILLTQWSLAALAGQALGDLRLEPRGRRLATLVGAGLLLLLVLEHPALRQPPEDIRSALAAREVVAAATEVALAALALALLAFGRRRAGTVLAVGVVAAAGLRLAWGFNPTVALQALPAPAAAAPLADQAGGGRVLPLGWVLQPNTQLLAGLDSALGVDGMRGQAAAVIRDRDVAVFRPEAVLVTRAAAVARCGASLLVADRPIVGQGLAPVPALAGPLLWGARLPSAHPLVAWYPGVRVAVDRAAARALAQSGSLGDDEVVLPSGPWADGSGVRTAFARVVRDPNRLVAEGVAPGAGVLVARVSADPGWRARLDGRPVAWELADGDFIGLRVAPGPHRVELDYRPPFWTASVALAILGLVLIALLAWRALSPARARPATA